VTTEEERRAHDRAEEAAERRQPLPDAEQAPGFGQRVGREGK
jgi:hypothetical protein